MVGNNRQAIVIYLHTLKPVRSLRRFGHVTYVSKKLKYAVIYLDQDQIEWTIQKANKLPFVRHVEPSFKPFVETQYENSSPDKAKEYDYKLKA